jgi:hypothetical protein
MHAPKNVQSTKWITAKCARPPAVDVRKHAATWLCNLRKTQCTASPCHGGKAIPRILSFSGICHCRALSDWQAYFFHAVIRALPVNGTSRCSISMKEAHHEEIIMCSVITHTNRVSSSFRGDGSTEQNDFLQ